MDERRSSERLTALCSRHPGGSMVFAGEWDFLHRQGTPPVSEIRGFRNLRDTDVEGGRALRMTAAPQHPQPAFLDL